MKMLQSTVVNWKKPYAFEKHWIDYYQKDIESETYLENKETIIKIWNSSEKISNESQEFKKLKKFRLLNSFIMNINNFKIFLF